MSLLPEQPISPGYAEVVAKTSKSANKPGQNIPPSVPAGVLKSLSAANVDADDEPAPAAVEPVARPGREDRKSNRIPVPSARRACELKVGNSVFPGLLADRSAGGFAVLFDGASGLKAKAKAELITDLGRFKVRIVYINKTGRPKDVTSQSDAWFRVGLRMARSFRLF
jgi:hypothetical protein